MQVDRRGCIFLRPEALPHRAACAAAGGTQAGPRPQPATCRAAAAAVPDPQHPAADIQGQFPIPIAADNKHQLVTLHVDGAVRATVALKAACAFSGMKSYDDRLPLLVGCRIGCCWQGDLILRLHYAAGAYEVSDGWQRRQPRVLLCAAGRL